MSLSSSKIGYPLALGGALFLSTIPGCNSSTEDEGKSTVNQKPVTIEVDDSKATIAEKLGMAVVLMQYDADKDSRLSEEEMTALFKQFDEDKDGYLSVDELIKAKRWAKEILCD